MAGLLLGLPAAAQTPDQQGTNLNADPLYPPSLNFYGLPGLMDMPSADPLPDGQGAVTVSHFAGITRTSLSYQFSPRISATFRYSSLQDLNFGGFEDYRDRNFDIRFLLLHETAYLPAVTVGLQDFAGTGYASAEYIVATKSFDRPLSLPGKIKATVGLGWGRLATAGAIGSVGDRPATFLDGDTGGQLGTDAWFRGPVAPFAGIEWQVNDRWGLKAEYSSDAYELEERQGVVDYQSRLNFGVEYTLNENLRIGGYYLYGSEFGITAQLQFNPRRAVSPMQVSAPRAVVVRPTRAVNPDAWRTDWATSETAPRQLRDLITPELDEQGLELVSFATTAETAELRFINRRYASGSIAVGRAARVLARILPPSVETFRLVQVRENLPLSTVIVRRSDLEALEFQPASDAALLSVAGIKDAEGPLPGAVRSETLHPQFSYSIGPYVAPSYFDPEEPVRADAGIDIRARYSPAPGWTVAGGYRYRLVGNVADGNRNVTSRLPQVRTNAREYAAGSRDYISTLYASYQWKPSASTYARVTAGYLERMFGGVSGEVLWKPAGSRLALGVEANYVGQRDFDGLFGFQDYTVATGHVSAYYEFDRGYLAQVGVGRYLAGDVGATFTLGREFANGWRVDGFFTLTNVSAEEFGEGSFDKGIRVTVPLNWFLGRPSRRDFTQTIRPIQRDGGARLGVPGRLYEQVREGHKKALVDDWARVWE